MDLLIEDFSNTTSLKVKSISFRIIVPIILLFYCKSEGGSHKELKLGEKALASDDLFPIFMNNNR